MSTNTLNPGAGDPMCAGCRCLITSPVERRDTRDGPMHERCRADGYRDVACRLLDKLEREGWRPDEVSAMTERIAGLNPCNTDNHSEPK